MTWFKVDDGFFNHRKVHALRTGPCAGDAVATWLACGNWSSSNLQEGKVPEGTARALSYHSEAVSELVRVGLWEQAEFGYVFHDWADYQPSAEKVEAQRKAGAERKRRSRERLSRSDTDESASQSRVRLASGHGGASDMPHGNGNSGSSNSSSDSDARAFVTAQGKVWKAFARARGTDPVMLGAVDHRSCALISAAVLTMVGGLDGTEFDGALERLLGAWMADPYVASKRPRLSHLAGDIEKYAAQKKPEARPYHQDWQEPEWMRAASAGGVQ